MDYPEWVRLELDDWPDFANRCKSILFERGLIAEGKYRYANIFYVIEWKRKGHNGSVFEVTRRPMLDHPDLDGLDQPQIVYAEVDCACVFSHWEAGLIYQHVIDMTERSSSVQKKRPGKAPREDHDGF